MLYHVVPTWQEFHLLPHLGALLAASEDKLKELAAGAAMSLHDLHVFRQWDHFKPMRPHGKSVKRC
jgi:hypothetical protein